MREHIIERFHSDNKGRIGLNATFRKPFEDVLETSDDRTFSIRRSCTVIYKLRWNVLAAMF